MADEFETCFNLCLIYSKDLKKILLKRCKNGKLDGLMVSSSSSGINQVEISKLINKELGLEIKPTRWQIVTTMPQVEKKWKIDVYLTAADIDNVSKEGFELIDTSAIPDDCHPNLKWIIPMSIDFTIYGSSFNQILMK